MVNILDEIKEFDFYTKETNALEENVYFAREKMSTKEAIEYAKEYDLIFEEVGSEIINKDK